MDDNERFHRIGDEAVFMRVMVHFLEGRGVDLNARRECHMRMKIDARDGDFPFRVLVHMPYCAVRICVDDKFLLRCDRKESQHMAA